jgi:hypothetical protein
MDPSLEEMDQELSDRGCGEQSPAKSPRSCDLR